jgi:hypothetical protein
MIHLNSSATKKLNRQILLTFLTISLRVASRKIVYLMETYSAPLNDQILLKNNFLTAITPLNV